MTQLPETRASLILRIANSEDAQAWEEFLRLYQPVVYRLACRQGLQHADAEELVQEVMLSIARKVEDWDPDPVRGRFRHWLFRIARNQIVNHLSRRKYQTCGAGHSGTQSLLEQQIDPAGSLSELFEIEYRRALFQHAALLVQAAVKERTWNAFWMSAVRDVPMSEVSQRLGMSIGSVYIARNRVLARLRAEVKRIEREEDGD
jgi:RNA polymerase sigma-70 factor (ECF subfamily)